MSLAKIFTATKSKSRYEAYQINKPEVFTLLLVLTIGSIVRFYDIGGRSIWTDEGFSEWASRQSLWYLWSVLPTFETNPPLYYTLLKGWRFIFGDGEAALRSLSAFFGVATIPFIFLMGRMLGNRDTGWVSGGIAAAIFALSPIHIYYAQEARAYTMLAFGVTIAMTGAMWLMLNQRQVCAAISRQPFSSKKQILGMLGLLALGMGLTMWSHDTGAFAVIALALPIIYWWLIEAKCSRGALLKLLITCSISFALFLPYLMPLLSHMGQVSTSFWVEKPSIWGIQKTVVALVTGTYGANITFFIFCALSVFSVITLWLRGKRSIAMLLVSIALFPILAEILVSFLAMPIFLKRTLLYVNIPLYIAIGYAISQVRIMYLRVIMAAIVIAFQSTLFQPQRQITNDDTWKAVSEYLSQALQSGQPVMLLPLEVSPTLKYYAVKQGAEFQIEGLPTNWPEPSESFPTMDAVPGGKKMKPTDMLRVSRLVKSSQRLALISRRDDLFDPTSMTIREIMKTHEVAETKKFMRGVVTVMIFTAR